MLDKTQTSLRQSLEFQTRMISILMCIFLFVLTNLLFRRFAQLRIIWFCSDRFKTSRSSNQSVVVGMHYKSRPDSYTVGIPVSKVIINQKFNRPGRYLTSDIMLVKLAHPVEFNDAVSPVCLLTTQFQVLPMGKGCYSSGWGRLSGKYLVLSQLLPPLSSVSQNYSSRHRTHQFRLPDHTGRLMDCNFLIKSLFKDVY